MNLRTMVGTTALVIGAMGVAAGTAHGAPTYGPVSYESTIVNGSVVTTLTGGSFELTADHQGVALEDGSGATLVVLPLSVTSLEGTTHPVAQQILDENTKLVLTPVTAPELASLRHDTATNEENTASVQAFLAQLTSPQAGIGGLAGAILGGLLLGVGGAVGGCALGIVFAGIGCPILGVAGAVAGTIAGVVAGAAVGGGAATAPTINDLFTTFTAAPWTTKFYNNPNNGLRVNNPIPVVPAP
ncbi:hypothetical protein [Antrihabitans sp. YC2-6]|uniref:hypothetical protein n=1 Tax=Antrihabitans sp. YC2-6 TaxID=2799498 RepID=UPI0018F38A11|nr:hypothetical protein [Antrihabitans sp. YC2-6]MBJ8348712.1 hypothetical protein [Antrihabitans sp. YC2-6]